MNLLHPILHNGKEYPAGEYKGGLPKDVEDHFKERGYFLASTANSGSAAVDPSDLNVKGIQKLKTVKEVVAAMETLTDEQLLELLELEEAAKKPRKGVKDAINDRLEED